jgi:3alpha(or 20beta)-hydroxysteroid dehydrogenase
VDRLKDTVALITGGASGMGAAESRMFVEEGAKVVITDIEDTAGEALAAELGDAAVYRHLDIAEEADWLAGIEAAKSEFGGLTAMITNAAAYGTDALIDTEPEEWDRIQRVNQRGTYLGMRAVLPVLEAAGGGGSIVIVSSVGGTRGMPYMFSYGVSKWALRGMGKYGAIQAAKSGVRVNTILPGVIDTPMQATNTPETLKMLEEMVPLGRVGKPEDIAAAAVYLVSDEASYVTGLELAVDGGVMA